MTDSHDETPRTVDVRRIRSGSTWNYNFTEETPVYSTYVLESDYRELERENTALRERVRVLEDMLFRAGAMDEPPCFNCGYNGEGYFQPSKHPCAARHHAALQEKM